MISKNKWLTLTKNYTIDVTLPLMNILFYVTSPHIRFFNIIADVFFFSSIIVLTSVVYIKNVTTYKRWEFHLSQELRLLIFAMSVISIGFYLD